MVKRLERQKKPKCKRGDTLPTIHVEIQDSMALLRGIYSLIAVPRIGEHVVLDDDDEVIVSKVTYIAHSHPLPGKAYVSLLVEQAR